MSHSRIESHIALTLSLSLQAGLGSGLSYWWRQLVLLRGRQGTRESRHGRESSGTTELHHGGRRAFRRHRLQWMEERWGGARICIGGGGFASVVCNKVKRLTGWQVNVLNIYFLLRCHRLNIKDIPRMCGWLFCVTIMKNTRNEFLCEFWLSCWLFHTCVVFFWCL